jgi:pimeloyl-ACP methyl ester carboxylesterase
MNRIEAFVLFCAVASGAVVTYAAGAPSAAPGMDIPTVSTAAVARAGFFYVGGKYEGGPGKEIMRGAMYVEVLVPKRIRHQLPIVLLHGAGQSGTDWLQTPDGRPGWAHFFVKRGYVVYLPDLPGRGRSAFIPDMDGALAARTAPQLSELWTASDQLGSWPQAKKYSQWPGEGAGKGKIGDRIFDDFARTQLQYPVSGLDQTSVDAGIALLDRIKVPVILLTHSLGGAFGWSVADARPQQVAAIVAVEPAGPPIQGVDVAKQAYNGRPNLPWGLTNLPIRYEPAAREASELQVALEAQPAKAGQVACYLQTGSPRKLVNLTRIPVLLVSGEAGYHRVFDECAARWLLQAGVSTDYVELEKVGLAGNGHQMMMEKNSDAIAAFLASWIEKKLR